MRIPPLALAILLGLGAPTSARAAPGEPRQVAPTATAEGRLTVDYPADGTIVPPGIVPPTFLWHDGTAGVDRWRVTIAFGDDGPPLETVTAGAPPPRGELDERCIAVTNEVYVPTPYQASAIAWRPDRKLWTAFQRRSVERPATITLAGFDDDAPERVLSRGRVTVTTSRDPVDGTIFYRDVPLMPSAGEDGVIKPLDQSALPLIAWRLKDVTRPDSRRLLGDMPTCANCHSFSADGATLAMDLDGPDGDKGAYAIAPIEGRVVIDDEQVMSWNEFGGRPPGSTTFGFLSRISPDGRHVVSTVNEALYVRNFPDHEILQVFFPTRGILASYSRETGEIAALPGADDPDYVHCNPVWTPDGAWLIFARARARDPYERDRPVATFAGDPNETQIRFDLYRMPWNDGRGGTPEPIPGASGNGMSNSFPKVSPDGKWLVWVKSRNGLLLRPDGRLWILPLDGGEPREMGCNTSRMNSWHSFSPNGRWLVFSSKANRPYTQMFLTHIDEHGNDSPPVLIENATAANRAVNIPEFVNVAYDEFTGIEVPAVDHYEPFTRGTKLARSGRRAEAAAAFEEALDGQPQAWRYNDWRIHENMSKVLLGLGDRDGAIEHIEQSLARNPYNAELHANLGYILFERGQLPRAAEHLDYALRLAPDDPRNWFNRATLRATRGDGDGAIADYTEALRRHPEYGEALNGRGIALRAAGRLDEAVADLDRAIALRPDDPTGWYFRALIREATGRRDDAARDAARALAACEPGSSRVAAIESLLERLGDRGSPRP